MIYPLYSLSTHGFKGIVADKYELLFVQDMRNYLSRKEGSPSTYQRIQHSLCLIYEKCNSSFPKFLILLLVRVQRFDTIIEISHIYEVAVRAIGFTITAHSMQESVTLYQVPPTIFRGQKKKYIIWFTFVSSSFSFKPLIAIIITPCVNSPSLIDGILSTSLQSGAKHEVLLQKIIQSVRSIRTDRHCTRREYMCDRLTKKEVDFMDRLLDQGNGTISTIYKKNHLFLFLMGKNPMEANKN